MSRKNSNGHDARRTATQGGAASAAAASNLRDRVSGEIRRMIIAGELRPGERLLQQQLATRFGVSQSVMREALLQAQFSGLVVAGEGTGASVARIDLPQVMDAYEAREVLEGLSARLCCNRASPADVRELTDHAHQVHALGTAGRDAERAQLDRHFHERIIDIAGNTVVSRLSQGYHVVRLVVLKVLDHEQILSDHLSIVEAIRTGNEDAAEQAARQHVIRAREMIRRQMQDKNFNFPWDAASAASAPPPPN
jgi:DNA-binding GntR family transcriptional regulator